MNYILYGKETYLINEKINKLISSFFNNQEDKNIIKLDYKESNISEIIDSLEQTSLFFETKKALIVNNATFLSVDKERKELKEKEANNLLNILKENSEDHLIIFILDKEPLKRSEIVKEITKNGNIIKFDEIKMNDFIVFTKSYILKKGYKISDVNLKILIDKIGINFYSFINEIDKLTIYLNDKKEIELNDINEIVSNNIEDDIFKLTNEILTKNKEKIFKIYNDLRILNVEVVTLISIITTNFIFYDEIIYLYKKGLSNSEIASELHVHPYRVQISLASLKNYKKKDIEEILNKLYVLDKNIKNNEVDRFFAFETFLINL